MQDRIVVRGARQHNLKNVSLDIPRNRFVVITGISGSGKSSLAFDTIYAEGQRRYVESLSTHARIFLEKMGRPDVDLVEGLSPAVSIAQVHMGASPRSTVGTVTEIHDYLRLLFARVGEPQCPICGRRIHSHTVQQMVDAVMALPDGTRMSILAPLVVDTPAALRRELARLRREGFVRVNLDGDIRDLSEEPPPHAGRPQSLEVYVDRLVRKPGIEARLADSFEIALRISGGKAKVGVIEGEDLVFSERFACVDCGLSLPPIEPRLFSFNTPHGACPTCGGLGRTCRFTEALIVPDPRLSLKDGAVAAWRKRGSHFFQQMIEAVAEKHGIDVYRAWEDLSEAHRRMILHGSDEEVTFTVEGDAGTHSFRKKFEGVIPNLERRLQEKSRKSKTSEDEDEADSGIEEMDAYLSWETCPDCRGRRLRKESLSVKVGGKGIDEVTDFNIRECVAFFENLSLSEHQKAVADKLVHEIRNRLGFLLDVGLDYLTLSRQAATLSAGEGQRIRLASQIGSGLVGVLYVLDEPSIGLHQRDNRNLLKTLLRLRDAGNSVIVVEHDPDTIRAADHVVDMGPGAGVEGGQVIASGSPEAIAADPASITGQYLAGRRAITQAPCRRPPDSRTLVIHGVTTNNLKNLTVRFPLGRLIAVTGVSGSGKSSLVMDTLLPAVRGEIARSVKTGHGETYQKLTGVEHVKRVAHVDQTPIGRTPRSNPATYSGVFAHIRELYASLHDSRARGYGPGRYSFNVKGGRCETCRGDGLIRVGMNFLPDVFVVCEACGGKRYNRETLEIRYRGRSISDILDMTASEALALLEPIPRIREKLDILVDVGLGYLRLGQSATTLSGGEAERLKLSRELGRKGLGGTLYILDEPTTGLHLADIDRLLGVLYSLVDNGNTVIVIEHNLDVIRCSDWVIDLGPEGGDAGGRIVAEGRPEQIAQVEASYTGQYLQRTM